MKSKMLKTLNAINWTAIAGAAFLIIAGQFDEGGGAISGLATVLALTAILWGPVVFAVSAWAFILEVKTVRRTDGNWVQLLKAPSTYVLGFMLYILSLVFLG